MTGLARDYVANAPALADFLGGPPSRLFSEPLPEPRLWDRRLTDAMRRHQVRLGNTRTFCGNETVIVTGQQPGLLGGPLYTVYKAATAVLLAGELSRRSGRSVLPVFWNASEDHDFEEVRSAHFLSRLFEPTSLTYTPEAEIVGLPMYRVPLEPSLHGLIDQAAALPFGSEDTDPVRDFLHASLDAADSFADWFSHIVARLFRDTPLLVFAPHWPEARRATRALLEPVLDDPLTPGRIVNDAGSRLAVLGYGVQVVKADDACPFFLEVGGRRRRVFWREGAFQLPEERLRYSRTELGAILASEPERFSPNVTLRPVVQQVLFPAAAYVAGPGEIAYWAQLRGVFDLLGVDMPVVYPRASAVLTTAKLRESMREFGLTLADLTAAEPVLIERMLPALPADPPRRALAQHRPSVESALLELRTALADTEPWAAARVDRMQARVLRDLDGLDRALARRDERALADLRNRLRRLTATLAPWREPQERVYTAFSFLFGQGWGLVDRILAELRVAQPDTHEIEL